MSLFLFNHYSTTKKAETNETGHIYWGPIIVTPDCSKSAQTCEGEDEAVTAVSWNPLALNTTLAVPVDQNEPIKGASVAPPFTAALPDTLTPLPLTCHLSLPWGVTMETDNPLSPPDNMTEH